MARRRQKDVPKTDTNGARTAANDDSTLAGNFSQPQPAQPSSNEQSGSTGRRAVSGEQEQGQDTGQGRYGQSGFAGGEQQETIGQAQYRRSELDGDPKSKSKSNRGSGRADPESTRGEESEAGQSGLKTP